jgi:hypothetical protein
MKLALGLIFTNELPFLKLHLPVYKDGFDGIVAITDPKTTDGSTEYLHSLGAAIIEYEWQYNWGDFATKLCDYAESLGYDAICRIDPDECLMPWAGSEIRLLLHRDATLLCFPRREFFGDRKHVRQDLGLDWQARAWRLRRGIVVGGKRHEGVNFAQHGLSEYTPDPNCRVLRTTSPFIYHYGWASPRSIWDNMVKYQSHAQIDAGGPPEVAFPPGTELVTFPTIEFTESQPLDPQTIGIYAPYEDQGYKEG